MQRLSELQDKFQRHLLKGDEDVLEHIVSDQEISNIQRLATYKNAYSARLIEALSIDFSSVLAILGEEAFSSICFDYIDQHPSTYSSLRWFGSKFPNFIKQHPNYQQQSYLAELANMDWMFINAFDAIEQNTLDTSCMMEVPITSWPDIRIQFQASVAHFSYHWNIIELWHAIKDSEALPPPTLNDQPSVCMIWRQGLATRFRVLDDDEAAIFQAAIDGASFGQLCEKLSLLAQYRETESAPDDMAMRSATLLKNWLEDGLITEINYQT